MGEGKVSTLGQSEMSENVVEHVFDFQQHLMIPIAENLKARLLKGLRSSFVVVDPFAVVSPVEFNDELGLHAGEVGDIAADRCLPTEFDPSERSTSNTTPKAAFGIRLSTPQSARLTRSRV